MELKNLAGLILVVAGIVLVFLRARKKGDLSLTSSIWPIVGQLGDALYIIGAIMIVLGSVMIAPDLGDILSDDSTTTTTTSTTAPGG